MVEQYLSCLVLRILQDEIIYIVKKGIVRAVLR